LHVNSGGHDVAFKEDKATVTYEGDADAEGGTAKFFIRDSSFWGFSSTGDFMDDNYFQNTRYTVSLSSPNVTELYGTACVSYRLLISIIAWKYSLQRYSLQMTKHIAVLGSVYLISMFR
jgi:hypothetical protein